MLIKIQKGEGLSEDMLPHFCNTWEQANQILLKYAMKRKNDSHDSGLGYDKTDFWIWIDAANKNKEADYKGRYDLYPFGKETDEGGQYPNLRKHVLRHLKFYSGTLTPEELPKHITPAQYARLTSSVEKLGYLEGYEQFSKL